MPYAAKTLMREEFIRNRLRDRLFHLSLQEQSETLEEKDLLPRKLRFKMGLKRLIKRIPFLGAGLRNLYHLIRYGRIIRENS